MRIFIERFMGSLSVGRKLALIYLLDLTAVIFISAILINEKFIAINFTDKEIVGNHYIGVLREVLLTLTVSPGAAPDNAPASAANRLRLTNALSEAEHRYGDQLGSARLSSELQQLIAATGTRAPGGREQQNAQDSFNLGRELLTHVGNQSNLILDPDLDSYYVMSLVLLRFPELLELIGATSQLAENMAAAPNSDTVAQQTRLIILEGRIKAIVTGINSDYAEAFQAATPALRTNLARSQTELQKALAVFVESNRMRASSAPGIAGPANFVRLDRTALAAVEAAWIAAGGELDRLLQARNSAAYARMWAHLGTAAALLTLILSLVFFVARQIAVPLMNLARVTGAVRQTGDYSLRAVWHSNDEIGRLVSGFNGMLEQLDQQRIAQQEMVAHASAAQAQRELVEAIPIPLMVTSIPRHTVLQANHAAHAWLNGQTEDPWSSGMEAAARAQFFQRLSDLGAIDELEVHWKGGAAPTWALVSARRIDYQGQAAVLTTFTPINRIKQMETRLELWAKVFEASSESIIVTDGTGLIVTVNRAFCRSASYEMHELVGQRTDFLLSDRNEKELGATLLMETVIKGSWQGEIHIRRKNGESYPAWLVMNAVRDAQGQVTHFIAISLDISERKANEQRIEHLAHHDVLTGLPNRFLCTDRLQLAIQQARRKNLKVAVLFLDLDRFKHINDSMGHHAGDGLLCSVAQRLAGALREGDTVSRIGGDEFVIILNEVDNVAEIGKVVDHRLIPAIQQPHIVDGAELYISCSIGIAVYPEDGATIEDLLRNADSAMYQAKKLGRNNAQFFTAEINDLVTQHLHLESDLRHVIERHELVLHYQPRIHANTRKIAGVESLVRWQHPTEGLILPGRFIPVAEESGYIGAIGAWILRQACWQHWQWREDGLGEIPISVNLSALQLQEESLIGLLEQTVLDFALSPGQIEFELTESVFMENISATIDKLEQIRALGFLISIDDFGTGYSSLNYLHRFPIDKLKIDQSFIRNMHSAPRNLAVTRAIIGLGHTLDMKVVAEGVELAEDVAVLRNAGCDELQGYYFARPMPPAQFQSWRLEHEAAEQTLAADRSDE